jgi:carbon storage regulator
MLILGRREGDSILIEGGIRIVVVSCDRGGVRLGIEAPPELKILRGEIAQQVASENQRAIAASADVLRALAAPAAPATVPVAGPPAASGAAAGTPPRGA